jgi:hypothetical protein
MKGLLTYLSVLYHITLQGPDKSSVINLRVFIWRIFRDDPFFFFLTFVILFVAIKQTLFDSVRYNPI